MDEIDRIERRLKLHDVRVLMSVVQAGSMNKAAERLGTSQPAVSRAISDLEHAFGVRLLDRSPTGIEPTPCGHAIIKRGLAVFDELRQGFKDIEFLIDPTAGELRIGCTEHSAAGPVSAVVDRLTRRHPRMAFEVVTAGALAVCRDLTERRVELAVMGLYPDEQNREIENFAIENLHENERVVVVGTQSPYDAAAADRTCRAGERAVDAAAARNHSWRVRCACVSRKRP
jgi:DNA-binding transcriptional LysR family regulator